jgi:hypothetical protein
MTVAVQGLQYYNFRKPRGGRGKVWLVREPECVHDSKAVAVYNWHGEKMGYVEKKVGRNERVFDRMLKNKVKAEIYSFHEKWMVIEVLELRP